MDLSNDMRLFSELIRCGGEIYTWCYDKNGSLLSSNCPEEKMLDAAFELFGCRQIMIDHGLGHDTPVTLGTSFGMRWSGAFEKNEDELIKIWVIGPFFYQDISLKAIKEGLHYYESLNIPAAWQLDLSTALKKLPTIQNTLMARYTLMLHYCITHEHLEISDIANPLPDLESLRPGGEYRDRHLVYLSEKALLDMVRNGDRNYSSAFSASMGLSSGVPVQSDEALRQAKTSIIVFTTLVTRAAMEGGLSPDIAYSLGDSYIQSAESSKTVSDLDSLAVNMYADFIERVHAHKLNPAYSAEIRRCIDYIEMHPDRKIQAKDLAAHIGYSEYYLTRKFKDETGMSVSDYVRLSKINRAKVLLESTDLSAEEISAQLDFSSRNYFSKTFKAVTGMTPSQYRESMRQ